MDIEGGEYEVIEHDLDFIKEKVEVILIKYHNIRINNGQSILMEALEASFDITIQNPHEGGSMLIATKKSINV